MFNTFNTQLIIALTFIVNYLWLNYRNSTITGVTSICESGKMRKLISVTRPHPMILKKTFSQTHFFAAISCFD